MKETDEIYYMRKHVELMNLRLNSIYYALVILIFMGVLSIPAVIFLLWVNK